MRTVYTVGGMETFAKDTQAEPAASPLQSRAYQLEAALAGMVAIHDSVTMGQERELREYWLPIARVLLKGV